MTREQFKTEFTKAIEEIRPVIRADFKPYLDNLKKRNPEDFWTDNGIKSISVNQLYGFIIRWVNCQYQTDKLF